MMKWIRKLDVVLIATLLVFSIILSLILWAMPFEGAYYAVVYIDGEMIERIPLDQTFKQTDIITGLGMNKLIVSEGMAFIESADCKQQDCVRSGTIFRPGGMIVCAPHRLIVRIEGES